MDSAKKSFRIDLTEEQRKQIREASGKDVSSIDVTITELEERIAPSSLTFSSVKPTYTPQT